MEPMYHDDDVDMQDEDVDMQDEDVDMQDYDVDMLAQHLESRLKFSNVTDRKHIRGVSVVDLIDDNSPRIPWSHRDCILMASHAARRQLHRRNCGTLWMDELISRMGMAEHARDQTYRDILVKKLTGALIYMLRRLHVQEHIIMSPRKPYTVTWKPHTRAWGNDSWDGDESRGRTRGRAESWNTTSCGTPVNIADGSEAPPLSPDVETDRSDNDCIFDSSPHCNWHHQPAEYTIPGALGPGDDEFPPTSPFSDGSPQPVDNPFGFSPVHGLAVAPSQVSERSCGSALSQGSVVVQDEDAADNDVDRFHTPPQSVKSPGHRLQLVHVPEEHPRERRVQGLAQPLPSRRPQTSQATQSQPRQSLHKKATSLNDFPRTPRRTITPHDSMSCQDVPYDLGATTSHAALCMQTSTPSVRTKMAHWLNHDSISSTGRSRASTVDERRSHLIDNIGTSIRGKQRPLSILELYETKAKGSKKKKDWTPRPPPIRVPENPAPRLVAVPRWTPLETPRSAPVQYFKPSSLALHPPEMSSAACPGPFDHAQQTRQRCQTPESPSHPVITANISNDVDEIHSRTSGSASVVSPRSPPSPCPQEEIMEVARHPAVVDDTLQTLESCRTLEGSQTPKDPTSPAPIAQHSTDIYEIPSTPLQPPSITPQFSPRSLDSPVAVPTTIPQYHRRGAAPTPLLSQEQISAEIARLACWLRFRRCSARDAEMKEAVKQQLLVYTSRYARHSAWVTLVLLSCGVDFLGR